MAQDLAWTVGYNAIALPLAAGVLAPLGIVLPAAAGAVLMSPSTIIVALNAQALRRLRLRGGKSLAVSRQSSAGAEGPLPPVTDGFLAWHAACRRRWSVARPR